MNKSMKVIEWTDRSYPQRRPRKYTRLCSLGALMHGTTHTNTPPGCFENPPHSKITQTAPESHSIATRGTDQGTQRSRA